MLAKKAQSVKDHAIDIGWVVLTGRMLLTALGLPAYPLRARAHDLNPYRRNALLL